MFSYYLRFFKALVRSFFRKRALPGEVTILPFRCMPNDGEYGISMNGAKMILLAEVSEQHNNMRTGVLYTCLKRGIWPVTKRYWTIHYKPVKVFRKGRVETRLAWWNMRCVIWENKVFVGDTLAAEIFAEVRVIGPKSRHTIRDMQRWMGVFVPSPAIDPHILSIIGKVPEGDPYPAQ